MMITKLLVIGAGALVAVTLTTSVATACDDMPASQGFTSKQQCEEMGYSYVAQTRNGPWEIAGPVKITKRFVPEVLKTDQLDVDACTNHPDNHATDAHSISYTKSDSITSSSSKKLGVEGQKKVNLAFVAAVQVKVSFEYQWGSSETSTLSETSTYEHQLDVRGCTHSRSTWTVLGHKNAEASVPLVRDKQYRSRCVGWVFSLDWSPWFTCGKEKTLATAKASEGSLSRGVESRVVVEDVACPVVHPVCVPADDTGTTTGTTGDDPGSTDWSDAGTGTTGTGTTGTGTTGTTGTGTTGTGTPIGTPIGSGSGSGSGSGTGTGSGSGTGTGTGSGSGA